MLKAKKKRNICKTQIFVVIQMITFYNLTLVKTNKQCPPQPADMNMNIIITSPPPLVNSLKESSVLF